MIAKMTDAGSMLWSTFDRRERALVLYGIIFVGFLLASALASGSRKRREDELADRIAERIGR